MHYKKKFISERVLHDLVLESIRDESFCNLIEDDAELTEYSPSSDPNTLPHFSLDHLTRKSLLAAGKAVFESFSTMEVLTSDKNISISKKEILRPDIVCINPENEKIIIIEIKNKIQTGREAITELLAYEHELKNTLPMVSNYDVCFVVVSPEWSTLMDHSVASAVAWSGRNILMLTADLTDNNLILRTRIPTAWNITGNVYFPDEAFPSVTVCLYEKDAYSPEFSKKQVNTDEDEIDNRLLTAIDVMVREGDKLGGHGFLLLWKDCSSITLTRYNLTVCGVSPFEFYKAMSLRDKASLNGHLSPAIDKYIIENDPHGHADSLIKVAKSAYPILKELSDPMLEGFHNWSIDKNTLKHRAIPIRCDFWGVLGNYSRAYVLNPAVRTHRRNTLLNGMGDWRDPRVGIPLIQSFTRPEIFIDGNVRCTDAFRLGVTLGLDRTLRSALKSNPENIDTFMCRYLWNRFDLMSALDEVRLLSNAATNVKAPELPIRFYEDPLANDDVDFEHLVKWITSEFFQRSVLHQLCFSIGFNGAVAFDDLRTRSEPPPDSYCEHIKDAMITFCITLLNLIKEIEDNGSLWGELSYLVPSLRQHLGLDGDFTPKSVEELCFEKILNSWELCLHLSEYLIQPVFHKHADVVTADVDWAWLKQGITEMRAEGKDDAGVILLPNGSVMTGQVMPQEIKISFQIDDPETQVPFLDMSNGFSFTRIVTWDELKSGEVFKSPSKQG